MLAIIATGFAVGLLVGLTGMGGSLLMTPLLILLYGFSPSMAVGTDLIYSAITKAVGSAQHWKQKTINWELVKKLAKGSIPGGIAGVILIQFMDEWFSISVDEVLAHVMGATFVFVSLLMLYRLIKTKGKEERKERKVPTTLLGVFGGFLVGLTSIGSGSLFMMVLLSSTTLPGYMLVGTDVVHAFFLTLSTGAIHAGFGNVDWQFVSLLLIGSIPGILLGGKLTVRVPELFLRTAIIIVLLATGIKMV
ncbi:sulfite exporter TauE/SafE family protein [Brevibacillus dissolubilis]|uniref:sulfite exporter TauE/SafE family protein n=1 Tax=Brevibacillus dissolubilis TaxID=1844116 RepID=UPI001116AFFF|nr:sulfite exporter TauE/SafE family protein [Brevibacillus dissolubilis]